MCSRYEPLLSTAAMSNITNYRPQRSCGQGYVFTRVCDSVNRGGSPENPPGPRRTSSTRQTPPPGPRRPPRTRQTTHTPPRTRQTPPNQGEPPPKNSSIRSMSGWYASYWNAFLFFLCTLLKGKGKREF